MPANDIGQQISFAIETDGDQKYTRFVWVHVGAHTRTIAKIAAHRGHPEYARAIADLNGIRSINQKLSLHKRIKVPGKLRSADVFHVLPQDGRAPQVQAGYAKYDNIDRRQRVGLTEFTGYDPIVLLIPIQFEAFRSREGLGVERDIALLERMAGRGNFPGTAVGPPPIIHISTTNNQGATVPLLPTNYQWRPQNKTAPLWVVTGIDWDESPLRNHAGNRVRQLADVTVQQRTHMTAQRSVTERNRQKPKPPPKKVSDKDAATFFSDPGMLDPSWI